MNNLKYLNDHSQKFFVPISKNAPPMAVFILHPETVETQRVERREAEKQLKPFPVRYGRQLPPYSPRLGRNDYTDTN